MENLGLSLSPFWSEKRVFITGHTGFKGSWLTLLLKNLGAKIYGYSLNPPSQIHLFDLAAIGQDCESIYGDIVNFKYLSESISDIKPEIIFHMAAQPLVRYSYRYPSETFRTNVLGTVNVFEAARKTESVKVIINVTSDKCYENKDDALVDFIESDKLGGYDPYSASKACAEIVAAAYSRSYPEAKFCIGSVRAGNVIGGGDFATDRLIPDLVRSFISNNPLIIRNPSAIRPWQHVLEPLAGYVMLAEKLFTSPNVAGAYNFGPAPTRALSVLETIEIASRLWGAENCFKLNKKQHEECLHEAKYLHLNSNKAQNILGWKSKLSTDEMFTWTMEWYKLFAQNNDKGVRELTLRQLKNYFTPILS